MAHPKTEPFDVRGGICGAQKNNAPCRQPLLAGWCPEHKVRTWTPAPTKPSAPHIGKGKYTSHKPGWIDGRTRAGRALKSIPSGTQPNGRRRTDKADDGAKKLVIIQTTRRTNTSAMLDLHHANRLHKHRPKRDDTWKPYYFYPRSHTHNSPKTH